MSIYKPTWLYIKQHNVTGLKYFGKTVRPDPYRYSGSGKYWLRHISKHGLHISTLWVKLFTDEHELRSFANAISEYLDIVNSDIWANLCPENGMSGGYRPNNHFKTWSTLPKTDEVKNKIRAKLKTNNKCKRIPVVIDGHQFTSILQASQFYQTSQYSINKWAKTGVSPKSISG